MTNTKYSLYREENRLTLVIDNPTEETAAMIMQLMGAGIKDLTGLNPVKQEETSAPERNPDAQKTVPQEGGKEENVKPSKPVSNEPAEKTDKSSGSTETGTQETADQAANPSKKEKYSYEELLEIVKSNKRIAEIGPVNIAVAIHPYLTDDERRQVLIKMCGKTQEDVAGNDKLLFAFKEICNSPKNMIPLANGYVRILRDREKQNSQQK